MVKINVKFPHKPHRHEDDAGGWSKRKHYPGEYTIFRLENRKCKDKEACATSDDEDRPVIFEKVLDEEILERVAFKDQGTAVLVCAAFLENHVGELDVLFFFKDESGHFCDVLLFVLFIERKSRGEKGKEGRVCEFREVRILWVLFGLLFEREGMVEY